MQMTTDELASLFPGNKKKLQNGEWMVTCPCHTDKKPSVHLTPRSGKTLLNDFGGCKREDILAKIGQDDSALYFPGVGHGKQNRNKSDWLSYIKEKYMEWNNETVTEVYHYSSVESGSYVFSRARTVPKNFHYFTIINGKAQFKLKDQDGNEKARAELPAAVYGSIKKIHDAIESGAAHTICYCEGEKNTDAVLDRGMLAFTAGAEGDAKREAERFAPLTTGADLIIFSDNDSAGYTSSIAVLNTCRDYARSIKIILPVKDKEHGDIYDFLEFKTSMEFKKLLEEANDTEDVARLAKESEEKKDTESSDQGESTAADEDPSFAFWDTYEPESLDDIINADLPDLFYPVKELIPEGLAIIGARQKSGKSWLMLDLCEAVATGKPFLGHETVQSDCLYFDLENSNRGLKRRLNLRKKEVPKNVKIIFYDTIRKQFPPGKFPRLGTGFEEIMKRQLRRNPNIKLVIVDVLVKVTSPRGRNESQYDQDYRNGGYLKSIADEFHVAIIVVTHLVKMTYDNEDPFSNISGTAGVTGSSDLNMVLKREKKDSPVFTFSMQGKHSDDFSFNMKFDRETFSWTCLGETTGVSSGTEQSELAEYLDSKIRKAAIVICEKSPNGYTGNVSGFIKLALSYGVAIPDTLQGVGKFLAKNTGKFADKDGIEVIVSDKAHGSGGKTYTIRTWRPGEATMEDTIDKKT